MATKSPHGDSTIESAKNFLSIRPTIETEGIKGHDPTPKSLHDQWRLTPSLLDPNSFAFTSFANQPPTYSAATPGRLTMSYPNQAVDLRILNMVMNLVAPLSIQTITDAAPALGRVCIWGWIV